MVKLKLNLGSLNANSGSSEYPPRPAQQAPSSAPVPASTERPKKPKAPKKPKVSNAGTPGGGASATSSNTPQAKPKKKAPPKTPAANGGVPQQPVHIKIKSAEFTPQPAPPASAPPKLKLNLGSSMAAGSQPVRTPTIKLRHTPKAAPRKRRYEPGNGYDSEASDREEDPAIEENFILRMLPGDDCDYLREVVERRELNTSSDVWMKFKDQRKAVINIRGNLYAGQLVDLPCIVEANKTLDKKNIFKAADICQMLLIHQRIPHEEAIWDVQFSFSEQQFPHGLTPPMQWARKRRFRKRISNRTIEAVEAEVDRLLREDEMAESFSYCLVDADQEEDRSDADATYEHDLLGDVYDDEQDADGEVEQDYEYAPDASQAVGVDEATLQNELDTALFEDNNAEAAESSDEDEDEDVAALPEEPEMDEAAKEQLLQKEKLREEIQDLEDMIASKVAEMAKIENNILKQRIAKMVSGFQDQKAMKVTMLEQLGG
ncbi:TAFII55 protein conserved region-domain-containing protein [Sphaerosporella brunnea]|uniref:TAFII55 protein conserved region-domain-containing protein n=1 Tax=Sphaerosporella brunnea TaxID=1250544 RepID=A0A5J5F4A9_9PEZI|nr:TAFII55 protein conserved region-domain-containing protein [Sphaerosporella brunnea]